MTSDFIDTYGVTGYFLRKLDLNTPSRVAMLSSLIHLQQEKGNKVVKFKDFKKFSLKQTDEKLETSSFKTLIKKLHQTIDEDNLILEDDNQFQCSEKLLRMIESAEEEFSKLMSKFE